MKNKNYGSHDHINAQRIVNEALVPAFKVACMGATFVALNKLGVPSDLLCSMILSAM